MRRALLPVLLRAALHPVALAALLALGPAARDGLARGTAEPPAVGNLDAASFRPQPGRVPYEIVYVRAPRFGDERNTRWPEVKNPFNADPGADLVLLHPDGAEEVLVKGGRGAVTDPFVSFDGKWVYFAKFHDLTSSAPGTPPPAGADIFRVHLESRQIERLTHGERTPNRPGDHIPASVLNLGPCPVPGGRIAFTSNRNGFVPTKPFTNPTMQLFVMDEDGRNVEPIAPMTLGSALHPTILRDGRLMFSTYESQGLRDDRLWGLWAILPDGRRWEPLVSAFHHPQAFHFQTELSDGRIVVIDYYNQNNNGFGAAFALPSHRPTPAFLWAFDNPAKPGRRRSPGPDGSSPASRFPFVPIGYQAITPFTHPHDRAASCPGAGNCAGKDRMGKVTHPSGAPDGDLLLVWTPGPATDQKRPSPLPRYDGGLYLLRGGAPATSPGDLILIKNDPRYNEVWPRAVVPYREIHGEEPTATAWLPNDGSIHPLLPPGTPFGLVGSSSLYHRESAPGSGVPEYEGLDPFNTAQNAVSSNWLWQGADAGKYSDADIWAVRLLALEPNSETAAAGDVQPFTNHANERHRILGEIPVRKFANGRPVLDSMGNPDTSFLVKIPADTPFTFQTLDRNGMVLNMAQTWHQVRPGEMRADCGGCHAHSGAPLPFETTAAARTAYHVHDLSKVTPLIVANEDGQPALDLRPGGVLDVEFLRDIRPLLDRSCVSCHGGQRPAGDLRLDDRALYGGLPGDYRRLADDQEAEWGPRSVLPSGGWRDPNASRYVRKFQSRRSLLAWKVFGARLDGWSNDDHPTESVPGDAHSLPPGAKPNDADLDYDGVPCPPPGARVPPLSFEEKLQFARWIDLGAPIDHGRRGRVAGDRGWFSDEIRPTLVVTYPKPGRNQGPLDQILIGAVDANSGLDESSLSIEADFPVNGIPPRRTLHRLLEPSADRVWTLRLDPPIARLGGGRLEVSVRDRRGNLTRIERSFSVE